MVDILLTHSNHLFHDRKQVRKMQPYPPLQTLLAAACLRRDGFEVALFDSTFEDPAQGFPGALEKFRPRLVAVCEDNFNFLTKMCLTEQRDAAFSMFGAARERGIPVVANGSDAGDHAAQYLDAGADYVIVGEAEKTLVELTRCLLGRESGDPRSIHGLSYRLAEGEERQTGTSRCCRLPPITLQLRLKSSPSQELRGAHIQIIASNKSSLPNT
jgi:radical SAM superfamily enzyme YgiQ (UPF0313 family)